MSDLFEALARLDQPVEDEAGEIEMQAGATITTGGCVLFAVAGLAHDEAYRLQRNPAYTSAIGQHCCGGG